MSYFNFDYLKHVSENLQVVSYVVCFYIIIFMFSWLFSKKYN